MNDIQETILFFKKMLTFDTQIQGILLTISSEECAVRFKVKLCIYPMQSDSKYSLSYDLLRIFA